MKKIILNTLVIVITVWSCSKKEVTKEEFDCCTVIDMAVRLNFLDNQNQDLLDSLTPNYYSYDTMKLYYIENGGKQEVNDSDAQFPKNLKFYKENDKMVMEMFVSPESDTIVGKKDGFEVGRSITYLELNKSTIDTIVSEWNRKAGYFVVKKIWYNGDYHELNGEPYQVKKDIN